MPAPDPTHSAATARISTPCVSICTLDAARERCTGCGRTLAEIGGWATMSEAERRAVMARLPGRVGR